MSLDLVHCTAEIIESVSKGQGTIKSLCYSHKHSCNKKLLYALVCECCRHYHALKAAVHSHSELTHQNEHFWMILLYEFVSGKFHYDLNHKMVQMFWKNKDDLKASYLKTTKSFPPLKSDAECKVKYLRVNRLVDADELSEDFQLASSEAELLRSSTLFMWDRHVPDLLVVSSSCNISLIPGFKNGALISMDKASCLPAFILSPPPGSHVIDCCAAPGNKTTQLAGYVGHGGRVFAIERDSERFETLKKMVLRAGARNIVECHNRDFLSLDPHLKKYEHVEYALVDPSCSGSGMSLSLERYCEDNKRTVDNDRLEQLAKFQTMAIKQAMRFPKVKAVAYSTCSVNERENEAVVQEILDTMPNWSLAHQPLPQWKRRGLAKYSFHQDVIRSDPKKDMMIGFFVALFLKS